MLSGEAFLARVFDAYRSATSEHGTNVWNTTLLIGWDEPGGTYDHVPPGPVPPPDPSAPPGECDFTFDRSGYRVPAIIVSPWVESGSVYNDEYRHTSLHRHVAQDVGTRRRVHAAGRVGPHLRSRLLARHAPRPEHVGDRHARVRCPSGRWTPKSSAKASAPSARAWDPPSSPWPEQMGVKLPAELDDPDATLTPSLVVPFLRDIAGHFFPLLAHDGQR